jgi:hypothetical protein
MTRQSAFIAGLLFVIATGLVNIGIFALDDYPEIIARIIPAGRVSVPDLIAGAGFRSPLPALAVAQLAHGARALGASSPDWQLRLVLAFLGAWSFTAVCIAARIIFGDSPKTIIAILFAGFYFINPFAFTRPMFESLGTPYLVLSAALACAYLRSQKLRTLLGALALLTVASLFRFQAGACLPVLFLLPVMIKRWRHLGWLALGAVAAFLLTGSIDLFLRGQFHASLRAYLQYNLSYSNAFGVTPFYTYALLFFGMSIPPLLLSRYRGFHWREEFAPELPVLLYFLAFVTIHSIVPHKEERFMLPAVPLFLFLLTPLMYYFWTRRAYSRLIAFGAINGILLVLASFNIAQNNVVGLGVFLNRHPEITKVQFVGSSLVITPTAYVGRDLVWEPVELSAAVDGATHGACDAVVICRQDIAPEGLGPNYREIEKFSPGVLEAILIRLNPRRNLRRGTIQVYQSQTCAE